MATVTITRSRRLRALPTVTPVPEPPLLTTAQCAEWLGIDESTLRRLRANDGFPVVMLGPGVRRYRLASVVAWVKTHEFVAPWTEDEQVSA